MSLGYFKTLFLSPGRSTFSEIPADVQARMGLSNGLDQNIDRTWETIERCLGAAKIG